MLLANVGLVELAVVAFLAAVAGGFGASSGAIWVARRDMARNARISMCEDLLPRLHELSELEFLGGSDPDELLAAVRQKTIQIASKDKVLAERLASEVHEWLDKGVTFGSDPEGEWFEISRQQPLLDKVRATLTELTERTENKLR